jgi:hypothetical protein
VAESHRELKKWLVSVIESLVPFDGYSLSQATRAVFRDHSWQSQDDGFVLLFALIAYTPYSSTIKPDTLSITIELRHKYYDEQILNCFATEITNGWSARSTIIFLIPLTLAPWTVQSSRE